MGDGRANVTPLPHWQEDSGLIEIRVHIHKSFEGVDSTSPIAAGSYYADLKSAAKTSQAAFNAVAVDAWATGDWYADLSSYWKQSIRSAFAVL